VIAAAFAKAREAKIMKTRIISNDSDKSRLDSSLKHRARYRLASSISSDAKRSPIKLVIIYIRRDDRTHARKGNVVSPGGAF
jgi:hypothetical protein